MWRKILRRNFMCTAMVQRLHTCFTRWKLHLKLRNSVVPPFFSNLYSADAWSYHILSIHALVCKRIARILAEFLKLPIISEQQAQISLNVRDYAYNNRTCSHFFTIITKQPCRGIWNGVPKTLKMSFAEVVSPKSFTLTSKVIRTTTICTFCVLQEVSAWINQV